MHAQFTGTYKQYTEVYKNVCWGGLNSGCTVYSDISHSDAAYVSRQLKNTVCILTLYLSIQEFTNSIHVNVCTI